MLTPKALQKQADALYKRAAKLTEEADAITAAVRDLERAKKPPGWKPAGFAEVTKILKEHYYPK